MSEILTREEFEARLPNGPKRYDSAALLAHDAALRADAEIAALKQIVGQRNWDALNAKVERLNSALREIAHQDFDCGLGKGICDTCNGPTIAREALEGKP